MNKRIVGSAMILSWIIPVWGGLLHAQESPAPATSEVQVIAKGKKVKFDYTLTVDAKVVDTSDGKFPIEYVQGDGQIIPGLARQMEGMKPGDTKTIVVAAEEGYGLENKDAFKEFPKTAFPKDVELQVGQVFEFQTEEGSPLPGVVTEIKEDNVLLNFNHPLAGKDLTFDIKVVSVE